MTVGEMFEERISQCAKRAKSMIAGGENQAAASIGWRLKMLKATVAELERDASEFGAVNRAVSMRLAKERIKEAAK